MDRKKAIKLGIGFATGRKSFRKTLKSYVYNWKESGLTEDENVSLNLFVAYDTTYRNAKRGDFVNLNPKIDEDIDGKFFISRESIERESEKLIEKGIIGSAESAGIFAKGYAAQRNAAIYAAVKNGMDYLIFLDDDEYPLAVTRGMKSAVWSGQHVLESHIRNLEGADYTNGHHCGYISPIPYVEYDDTMTERDFRSFIEAISNDIVNWDKIRNVMEDGGVTYADKTILVEDEVPEINNSKFISGSNLGINLTDPRRLLPFYNPPGARGEDTFLGTCLHERKVVKVPCYTFHDGFASYNHLLEGVLPTKLKCLKADNPKIVERFYQACIGWIRYKPLFLYITQPDEYGERIATIRRQLEEVLPKIAGYFDQPKFLNILPELNRFDRNVAKHYSDFTMARHAWSKIMDHLAESAATRASV
ncbi:hypothetical protein [Curtanaerobium respiraculi]|uniref:hypothetical protein n=1 Tax=Curtanaerobium respiraculi TaxID=2949669 RepID=UPI0024B37F25|nr:hypothetical protein [Curtanaerobium respiraculi]